MQRAGRLQVKVAHNRERIRGQLKQTLFRDDRLQQGLEKESVNGKRCGAHCVVSLEVQTPLKTPDVRVSHKKFQQRYELCRSIGEGAHGVVKLGYKKTEI